MRFRAGSILQSPTVRLVFGVILLLTVSQYGFAGPVTISPQELSFDAQLNAPVVLRLDVLSSEPLGQIELRADGFEIQREIHTVSGTQKYFLIEAPTLQPGHVSGMLHVLDSAGGAIASVPVAGTVKPYIRVSPSKLFLGSLEYGTQSDRVIEKRFELSGPEGWTVLDVDRSRIKKGTCEILTIDAIRKELVLRVREDSLKQGEPFGAFINLSIRLKTSVRDQPEVIIPVTALLSKNGTSRDFKKFLFMGAERWQGGWSTPNVAGAVLAPLVLLGIGYGAFLIQNKLRHTAFIGVGLMLCLGTVFSMVLLAKTYSRGGWCAFAAGAITLITFMKGCRRVLSVFTLVFVLIVSTMPSGIQRVGSAGSYTQDLSIRNRLLLWRGALEMIADYPGGVGIGHFGGIFGSFYQEPWHSGTYSMAVNDFLTLAAERGIAPLLMIMAAGVFLLALSVQLIWKYSDAWAAPVCATLVALCTSSFFSCIEFVREVRAIALICLSILTVYCIVRGGFATPPNSGRQLRVALVRSVICAFVAAFIARGSVAWAEAKRSVRHVVSGAAADKDQVGSKLEYYPGQTSPKGAILFLPNTRKPLAEVGRRILRPLAQRGLHAITATIPPYDQDAARALVELLAEVEGPLVIIAEGSKARVATKALSSINSNRRPLLGLVDPVLASALPECDESRTLDLLAHCAVAIDSEGWEAFKETSHMNDRVLHAVLCACVGSEPSSAHIPLATCESH